jgi:hypothetical protein
MRELSRFMSGATPTHVDAMKLVMAYYQTTSETGLMLKPYGQWDGKDRDYKFIVHRLADGEHAADEDTRYSVGGQSTFLNSAQVVGQSKMQGCVTLSVTEAELVSGCDCT